MKKAFIVTLALFLAFSMATFAAAEDRLKISGDFRVRAFSLDDRDYNSDAEDHASFIDQRMRVEWRINVMDGVAVRLRTDYQEDTWGLNTGLFGRPDDRNDPDSAFQIDRAFLQINKPKFDFMIGHLAQYWGQATAYGPQEMGAVLVVKTPVELTFNYFKLTENGSTVDDVGEDKDMYAVMAAYPNSSPRTAKNIGLLFAMVNDDSAADDSPYLIGLWGNYMFNALKFKGELDIFGGDSATTDYEGTQLYLGLEYPFTKMFTGGANFYYAKGADAGETQLDVVWPRFGGFENPSQERALQGFTDTYDVIGNSTPFDPWNQDTGVVGLDAYGLYKLTPAWTMAGQLGYYAAEEDQYSRFDSMWAFTASLKWAWAKGADLFFAGTYTSPDGNGNVADDSATQFMTVLQVSY